MISLSVRTIVRLAALMSVIAIGVAPVNGQVAPVNAQIAPVNGQAAPVSWRAHSNLDPVANSSASLNRAHAPFEP